MSTYSSTAAPTKQSADSVNQSGTIAPSVTSTARLSRTQAGHNPITHAFFLFFRAGNPPAASAHGLPGPPAHSHAVQDGTWQRSTIRGSTCLARVARCGDLQNLGTVGRHDEAGPDRPIQRFGEALEVSRRAARVERAQPLGVEQFTR